MEHLTDRGVIRDLMQRYGFQFSKAKGQNFIVNPSVCPRIAQAAGLDAHTGVIEIGAGFGVLTHELALRAGKVVVIEIDQRLLPVLEETLAEHDNVTVLCQDVLQVDLAALIAREFAGMRVVVAANLPYYITSPILMKLLEERLPIESITVMVQKEAAARITAPLPSRQAGALTAAVRYYSEPEMVMQVSRGSFFPAPQVDSSVIRLRLHTDPPVHPKSERAFFHMVRAGFSTRRKTLLNCLCASLELEKGQARALLAAAGLGEQVRAEELSLADFARLADLWADFSGKG